MGALAEARWTDSAPVLDGRLDEPAWRSAMVLTNFQQAWLGPAHYPTAGTRARLLWDREYLYFAAEVEDSDLVASVTAHDGPLWEADVFEFFFRPNADRPAYYEFEVNPLNTSFDAYFPDAKAWLDGRLWHTNRPFHMETAVRVDGTVGSTPDRAQGWTVEGRLPWRDFLSTGGRPEPGSSWQFTLCRIDHRKGVATAELSATAPLGQPSFHRTDDYAPLRFVGPSWLPALGQEPTWTASKLVGSPEPPAAYRVVSTGPRPEGQFFVGAAAEPGTDHLLYITHDDYWGGSTVIRRTRLGRGSDDLSAEAAQSERLLVLPEKSYSLCFHPGFLTNHWLYVGGNGAGSGTNTTGPKHSRVVRFTYDPATGRPDPASRLVIIEWPSDGHNGAAMCFGNDGMMYVSSGDGTSDSDANNVGQDLTHLTSKILRLDVAQARLGQSYEVPRDNPFLNVPGARPETWAFGCRNPWRLTADPVSGQIWSGENGQDLWEYAYIVRRGSNHGWSVREGGHPFLTQRKEGPVPPVAPEIEHSHAEFRSLTGGLVYRGKAYPELVGAYIYGDFSTGRIWAMRHDGTNVLWHHELVDTSLAITGFAADRDGEVLVVDHTTGFFRLTAALPVTQAVSFPQKLSATGLFGDVPALAADPALMAYSVNSPQWLDGAVAQRWLALPAGHTAEFTQSRAWNLSNGAVLVQHIELALDQSKPGERRRLETRVLLKQDNEWAGYSYVWNDAQTDAELGGAEGMDRQFEVRDPAASDGHRAQSWRVPSRAECMMCHARAANYVLGLTSAQLNHGDQLQRLERFGRLRVDWAGFERWRAGVESTSAELPPAGNDVPPGKLSALLPRLAARLPAQVNPRDPAHPLEARVRSYLAANCAPCHVPAGGGNAAMDLDLATPLANTGMIGAKPQHWTFDAENPLLIAPGSPDRSVMWRRVSQREEAPMPPLAVNETDREFTGLLAAWIRSLKP